MRLFKTQILHASFENGTTRLKISLRRIFEEKPIGINTDFQYEYGLFMQQLFAAVNGNILASSEKANFKPCQLRPRCKNVT